MSTHTSGVFSGRLTGNLAQPTQRGTGQVVRGVESLVLFPSRKLETQEKAFYLKYSSRFQVGSIA
jgi:hypothetical protein